MVILEQLKTLATKLAKKHYPELTQWEPLDSELDLLFQIDLMNSNLIREEIADELATALQNILDVREGKGGTRYHCDEIARIALAKYKEAKT